jgi:hypothetical protein
MREFRTDTNKIIYKTSWDLVGAYKEVFGNLNDKLYPCVINDKKVILGGYNNWHWPTLQFMNIDGYRSDNFKKNTENDIVFLGCSQTFGVGIAQNFTWPKVVLDSIAPNNNLNNLSLISGAIEEIIYNFFKYCNIYDNPGTVFFLMPEIHRGFEPILELAQLRAIQFYQILEIYCNINNINLISSTWDIRRPNNNDQSLNDFFDGMFDTFYKINIQDYAKDINDFMEKNSQEEYLLVARDKKHMGIAMHHATAKFMVEKYLNLTSKQE